MSDADGIVEVDGIPQAFSHTGLGMTGALDSHFIEQLRSLGVDESKFELSEDVLNEPVEILVNLVKNEDIDPWDIDIVDITDRFLARIEEMKLMDLRISGRTLLYAAILLRIKSTGMIQEEEEEDLDPMDDELDFYDVEEYPVPKFPIRRRATRPVTLEELLTELQKAERVDTRRKDRQRTRRISEKVEVTTEEVLGIAHEEDIKGRVGSLHEKLLEMFGERECVTLSQITGGIERSEKIMTYVSLLFLAAEKKVSLIQKELFGELYIHPNDYISQGHDPDA